MFHPANRTQFQAFFVLKCGRDLSVPKDCFRIAALRRLPHLLFFPAVAVSVGGKSGRELARRFEVLRAFQIGIHQ